VILGFGDRSHRNGNGLYLGRSEEVDREDRQEPTMMRPGVEALFALGPFPDSDSATGEDIERRLALLDGIPTPLTGKEAAALVRLFGPDDYFGLGFSLRRLIESADGWPIWDALEGDNPWIRDLRDRAINAGFEPPIPD
jgi:hypothetical protein